MVDGGLVPSPPARLSLLANNLASNCPKKLLNTSKSKELLSGIRGLSCQTTNYRDEKDWIRREENSPDDNNFSSKEILGSRNRRREILLSSATAHLSTYLPSIILHPPSAQAISDDNTQTTPFPRGVVLEIEDPNTYSAVVYVPRAKTKGSSKQKITDYPLLVVLHGAGNNQHSAIYEFTNAGSPASPPGDHTNLPPYLLSREQAPNSLSDNFVVVAPYVGKGKVGSLYDEPRSKILSFIKWFNKWIESQCFEADGGVSLSYSIGINRTNSLASPRVRPLPSSWQRRDNSMELSLHPTGLPASYLPWLWKDCMEFHFGSSIRKAMTYMIFVTPISSLIV